MTAGATCPTCDHPVEPGMDRCPGCGRVLGEANRCPRCGNVTALRRGATGYTCAACGAPREHGPHSVVLEEGAPGRGAGMVLARGGALGLRLGAMGALAAGVTLAAVAVALLPGPWSYLVALLGGGLLIGLGLGGLRVGARASAHLSDRAQAARELRILELAESRGGSLTATEVARDLGTTTAEADQVLTRMADGSRVIVDISPEGIIHYVFREVDAQPAAKVRVEVGEPDGVPEDGGEAEGKRDDKNAG